jgi:hypothetical protein
MKRLILIALFLCVAVSAQASKVITPSPTGHGTFLEIGGPLTHDNVYNVKDFGAKGDGVTRDNGAIVAALDFAVSRWVSDNNAKTTIYFPAGDYALLHATEASTPSGVSYACPDGFGGLTIAGEGGNASRLLWTGTNDLALSSAAYAIELKPTTAIPSASERLHDITIRDIGVFDNDPDTHDNGLEETHGFIIKETDGVLYDNILIDSVGDEAIIVQICNDVTFNDCTVRNNLYTGADGVTGAGINIVNKCDNILIKGAHLYSDRDGERGGVGISFENLQAPHSAGISNVTIESAVIQNCAMGMRLSTGFGPIDNLSVGAVVISNCDVGVYKAATSQQYFRNISFSGTIISNVHTAVQIPAQGVDVAYSNNISFNGVIISDVNYSATSEAFAPGNAMVLAGQNVSLVGTMISDVDASAILFYDVKDVTVNGGVISNTNNTDTTYAGIDDHISASISENIIVDGVVMRDIEKQAIGSAVNVVKNCDLEVADGAGAFSMSGVVQCLNNTVNQPINSVPTNSKIIGNRFVSATAPVTYWMNLANVSNGIVVDNYFETGSAASFHAIWARTTTSNCIITGNNATNHQSSVSLYFQGSTVGNVIFNNNIGDHKIYQVDLAATTALPPISVIQVEGTSGSTGIVCTAEPSIAIGAFIGQEMTILGEDDTDHWTLQSGALFKTNLGAATRQLDVGSVLVLKWDGALWQEVLYSA